MHKGACAGVGEALMVCLYPLCAGHVQELGKSLWLLL